VFRYALELRQACPALFIPQFLPFTGLSSFFGAEKLINFHSAKQNIAELISKKQGIPVKNEAGYYTLFERRFTS
jgi:hypothetical protein